MAGFTEGSLPPFSRRLLRLLDIVSAIVTVSDVPAVSVAVALLCSLSNEKQGEFVSACHPILRQPWSNMSLVLSENIRSVYGKFTASNRNSSTQRSDSRSETVGNRGPLSSRPCGRLPKRNGSAWNQNGQPSRFSERAGDVSASRSIKMKRGGDSMLLQTKTPSVLSEAVPNRYFAPS